MTRPIRPLLAGILSLVFFTAACGPTTNAAPGATAASTSQAATTSTPEPTEVVSTPTRAAPPTEPVPTATITFAPHPKSGWTRIPTIVIVGKQGDPRFAGVEQAVQWWNAQLQSLGSPFHFGAITENTSLDSDQLVPAKYRTADSTDPGNPVTGDLLRISQLPGRDIIIALSSYDLTSRNLMKASGSHLDLDLILIKDFTLAGFPQSYNGQGAVIHELGHALGLMHDSSTNSIMCGPPWDDQKGCLGRGTQVLLDQDKQYLLTIYPPSWKPSP